jgi:hypothetical protein
MTAEELDIKWEELKKDSEATDNKPCKDLGICEVKFGCYRGSPYVEIMPITSRIKSDEGLQGLVLMVADDVHNLGTKRGILELANNASELNDTDNIKKSLEDLLKKRQAKANAIKSLEI